MVTFSQRVQLAGASFSVLFALRCVGTEQLQMLFSLPVFTIAHATYRVIMK